MLCGRSGYGEGEFLKLKDRIKLVDKLVEADHYKIGRDKLLDL